MKVGGRWATDENVALLTDLYELTMVQAYWRAGMAGTAVFSLFVRRLPPARNYLLACGLEDALGILEGFRFSEPALEYLSTFPQFSPDSISWLRDFRCTGGVYVVPEGTPVFPDEPLLEVVAPVAEALIVETLVMNQVHSQTVGGPKASRVVTAARGRAVVDFGIRRMHGVDAGLKSARALHVG